MGGLVWKFLCLLAAAALVGCAAVAKELTAQDRAVPRKIAVFLDGTANDETADTNVKKLHALVSLQGRKDISTFYIEGVGAQGKVGGMATGWGIGDRVRKAYIFLLREHRPGDEIYIFGFSRGAYAGRILASMLHNVGVPDFRTTPSGIPEYGVIANVIYESTFNDGPPEDMRQRVAQLLASRGMSSSRHGSVPVKVLGLFDSVEALGRLRYDEDVGNKNRKYGDQLCNVEHAYHAMSLDDNRATVFTPKLLTRAHVFDNCPERRNAIASIVDEVWFSGAHSDVGGGYLDSLLSGVPLNWMIRKLRPTGLLPAGAAVREDHLGLSHDAEELHLYGAYQRRYRNLTRYVKEADVPSGQKLRVHRSVIDRLERCGSVCAEKVRQQMLNETDWETRWFKGCFVALHPGYRLVGSTDVCRIEVAEPEWRAAGMAQR